MNNKNSHFNFKYTVKPTLSKAKSSVALLIKTDILASASQISKTQPNALSLLVALTRLNYGHKQKCGILKVQILLQREKSIICATLGEPKTTKTPSWQLGGGCGFQT